MSLLTGKTALVTGAASGIGLATAIRFAQSGARVIGLDKKAQVTSLACYHDSIQGVACDVADADQLSNTLATILQNNTIDILVNNAGINPAPAAITETAASTWNEILETNLSSIYRVSKAVIPCMGQGAIVNISSILALVGARNNAAYAAAKGAILSLTRSMAKDHGPDIRVNCICPGPVQTDMFEGYLTRCPDPEAERARIIAALPLQRLGTPAEVASAVLFLASAEAAWITGAILVVDGGDSA